jgi:hypothetical protein
MTSDTTKVRFRAALSRSPLGFTKPCRRSLFSERRFWLEGDEAGRHAAVRSSVALGKAEHRVRRPQSATACGAREGFLAQRCQ